MLPINVMKSREGTIDIIGNRRLVRAEKTSPPRGHRLGSPPSGGRQEGGSPGGREDWGHTVRTVPPPRNHPGSHEGRIARRDARTISSPGASGGSAGYAS